MFINYLLYNRSATTNVFLKKIYSLLLKPFLSFKGSYIGSGAKLGKHIVFPHGVTGIFISQGAEIGSNCVIFHQVTIGSNTLRNHKRYGAPKIGSNVYIGVGAKIIGNVRIGANAVVVKDIPDNSTVVNQPVIIYKKNDNSDNRFIPYSIR